MAPPRRPLPRFCGWNQNRVTGKWRVRFRRGRFSCYLPMPEAPEFAAAYAAGLAGAKPEAQALNIGADRTIAGSLGAIIKAYLDPRGTSPFQRLAAETQRTRRNILENFAAVHGDKPLYRVDPRTGERIMLLKREHMQRFVNEKTATPSAQRNFRTRCGLFWSGPSTKAASRKIRRSASSARRSRRRVIRHGREAQIARFEATHVIGTKARLAFALLLYTGQRRSDVVGIGLAAYRGRLVGSRSEKDRRASGDSAASEIARHHRGNADRGRQDVPRDALRQALHRAGLRQLVPGIVDAADRPTLRRTDCARRRRGGWRRWAAACTRSHRSPATCP